MCNSPDACEEETEWGIWSWVAPRCSCQCAQQGQPPQPPWGQHHQSVTTWRTVATPLSNRVTCAGAGDLSLSAGSRRECLRACLDEQRCNFVVYRESPSQCQAYAACSEIEAPEGVVAYVKLTMTWADSVPEASRCAGEPLNINGVTWGGLGRGTRGECQDACLVEPLCNYLVFRASDGECSAFQSCAETVPADGPEVDVYRKLQEVDRDEERASVALRLDGLLFAALSEEQRGFLREQLATTFGELLGVEPTVIKNSAGVAGRVDLADAGASSVAVAFSVDAVAEMGMNQITSALGTSEASQRVAGVVRIMPQASAATALAGAATLGLSHIAVRIRRDQVAAAPAAVLPSLLEVTGWQRPASLDAPGDTRRLLASAQSAAGDLTACRATSAASASSGAIDAATPMPSSMIPSLAAGSGRASCNATAAVQVTLGGAAVMLNPRRNLMDGEVSALPCESVNSGYRGVVWLDCLSGSLVPDASRCQVMQATAGVPGACEAQLRSLEAAYATAYVQVTRLISQYEELSASTACEGAAEAAWRDRHTALQLRADQLSASLSLRVTSMASLRPNLEGAITAEERLRSNVALIAEECQALPNTTSDLGRVRDAIEALSRCPGLGRPHFAIPRSAGDFVEGSFDLSNVGDEQIDQQMDALCRGAFPAAAAGTGTVRAAETGELEQQSIEGMPATNTASVPLMGSCPGCAGVADAPGLAQHASGHARICWDPLAELTLASRRNDCTAGRKAVLCVVLQSPPA